MYYFDILAALAQYHIRYLVGGLAVNLHGIPRMTQDIDLIVSVNPENIEKLCSTLKTLGYIPRLPVNPLDMANPSVLNDWIENRHLKAFSFYHSKENYRVVDIVLVHPLDFEAAFSRRTMVSIQNIELSLLAIADLITMKEFAGRQQDLADIAMLRIVQQQEADEHDQ